MIGHVNLLDKVYYLNDKKVYESTIISKVYKNLRTDSTRKFVSIIFNDKIEEVNTEYLFYTKKEAYEQLLKTIEKLISAKEKSIQKEQEELKQLNNYHKDILDKLDNISN